MSRISGKSTTGSGNEQKSAEGEVTPVTASYRILKTNRDEYLILLDDGQDFEALYGEWCALDDAFCEGKLPENKWMDVGTFLRKKDVTVIEPFDIQTLADFYSE